MTEAADEFASLVDVAAELGLSPAVIPSVSRTTVEVADGQRISALIWGSGPPEIIFVHGGGQNAHTWDLVALGLGRPAVAVDLPGHGHSDWRGDHDYWPGENARSVAAALDQLAPQAAGIVGMSLGGLTTIQLSAARPDLAQRVVIVDVTPGVMKLTATMTTEQRGATALTSGPKSFASRDEMVAAAIKASPGRPESAVRRGVIHNTKQQPDGSWAWRYDLPGHDGDAPKSFEGLWQDVEAIKAPVMLVRGGNSAFVSDEDVAEFVRLQPGARIEVVSGAGHAVQSDQPKVLTGLLNEFIFS